MMDIELEEKTHQEVNSLQESKEKEVASIDYEELKKIPTENCTNNLNLLQKEETSECTEKQEDYVNLSSARSEFESEATNLSSTLDSRDDENEKECESSLDLLCRNKYLPVEIEVDNKCEPSVDLSYKNKSLPNSIESSLDNSENGLELTAKTNATNEECSDSNFENANENEKHLYKTKINGSNQLVESEKEGCSENTVEIEENFKENFTVNDNSCSSSSSSVGLVIDQQPDFPVANPIASQITERDKNEIEEINHNLSESLKINLEENLQNKNINDCDSFKNNLNKLECSKEIFLTNIKTDNLSDEKLIKEKNLKRKISFCKDNDNSHGSDNSSGICQSPQHKILHLDEGYLNNKKSPSQNVKVTVANEISEGSEQGENFEKLQLTEKFPIIEDENALHNKSSSSNLDMTNSILRNQLVIKIEENDPGGTPQHSPENIENISSSIIDKNQIELPDSTRLEQQIQNDNRNLRFSVPLSNFGNNYLYEKSDKLIALNSTGNLTKINSDKNEEPHEIVKTDENVENTKEIIEVSSKAMKDFSNNLILNNQESSTHMKNKDNFGVQGKYKNESETSLNTNFNSFSEEQNVTNDTLIDLTNDIAEASAYNTSATQSQTVGNIPKEKILQEWNKTNSLPLSLNQSSLSQDLTKQSTSDMRRLDGASLNKQLEPLITNRLDAVINYTNNSKLLNSPSWKFALKYKKPNKNIGRISNKSMKKSSKNLHQNNKNHRQINSTKKVKNSIAIPSTNSQSGSIINSPQFNLPNKLNPPIIPPVYELSHTLNRHTEYKCSKCLNSNFKNIRELENHHKFCLYGSTNSNEVIFMNSNQHQQLGLSSINHSNNNKNSNINSGNNSNSSRLTQFSSGINNLIHNVEDVMLNIPKESNIRNLLHKQQSPLFNINDKPIEITPNLNHYLNQVEQKHKNLLQHHHHLSHNQNLFSHSLDETIKRSFLQNDARQQNLVTANEQKLNADNYNNRFSSLLTSGFQNKKKLHLQQQQIPASFLDNGNILDYPIIQDSSNIFEINDGPLSFNPSGLQKSANVGIAKGLRRFSNSGVFGSNIDISSNTLTVLNKNQLDNTQYSSNLQQKTDSLEPIMLKVKQNQFSPILPPEQLLNKLSTSTSLSTSLSSTSSSLQDSLIFNTSVTEESSINTENTKRKIPIEIQNNESIQNRTIVKDLKSKGSTQISTTTHIISNLNEKTQQNSKEDPKSLVNLTENKNNKKTKKLFLCSSCGSYHENWNLFLHMREMHKRHICLLCLRMFPTAEQLTVHLEMKHDIEQNHFESQEKLIRSSRDSCYLMCCTCEHIFTEHDDFYQHICANYLKPCNLCGLLGKHALNCRYAANEHKRSKRGKKQVNSKLQQNMPILNNHNETKIDLPSSEEIIQTKQVTNNTNEILTLTNPDQPMTGQSNNCDITANNQKNTQFKEFQNKSNIGDLLTNTMNDERNSDSNNGSDSDSNNRYNGYLEHFNYNDNDLINLYKSNRLANLAKQKEKEEAEAKTKSLVNQNPENQLSNIETEKSKEVFSKDYKHNSENSNKMLMPKLTLKISKEMFNRAQDLAEDSDELSSNESSDAEDNEVEIEDDTKQNTGIKSNLENIRENQSNINSTDENADMRKEKEDVKRKSLEDQKLLNNILEVSSEVQNKENIESVSQSIENKSIAFLDESKSDSDMDIDVTCNQGGDVAPVSLGLGLQSQSQILASSVQSNESSTDAMQVDKTPPTSVLNEKIKNNDHLSNTIELSQPDVRIAETLSQMKDSETSINYGTNSESQNNASSSASIENPVAPIKKISTDGIELANDDVQISELNLDAPLDKIPMVSLLRIMLKETYPICLYCNHARRIAVNGNSLALHMLSSHRFSATVDSITAEELLPGTIISKLKSYLKDLNEYYFNMETYCNIDKHLNAVFPTIDEKIFECFSCRFSTRIHKELYLHNRKMHLRTAILCFMCRSNFYSYSEILCHICPGAQYKVVLFDIKFRCCICDLDQISSAFRLMVHLRKAHFACDVCLENCFDQSRLSSHVWKHKLHHLCYRCGIAYRNKPDITKHLFWKHGTESVLCKRCLQKRWPHVYHFCIPPTSFVCEVCNLAFTRAMYLKVHKRIHTGDAPYPCTEDNCDKKFISRKLLLKHVDEHEQFHNEDKLPNIVEPEKTIKNESSTEDKPEVQQAQKDEELSKSKTDDKENTEETDGHVSKKKKKKTKRSSETKETLEDLNLQAPNLSESGSSDDSDTEASANQNSLVPNVILSPPSEQEEEEEGKKEASPEKIIDIWNNFKTFQAAHNKIEDNEIEDNNIDPPAPILHVVQSDHDYCKMYKIASEKIVVENGSDKKNISKENSENLDVSQKKDKSERSLLLAISPSKKKMKSAKKSSHTKSGSDSSSSDEGSSSSSDSSCTCGSNCSCSSTTDSSSDSSSSSDTDSSSSEGKRRVAAKRAAKEERRRNRLQSENSSKANNSDVIDVVTTDLKPEPKLLEPVIYEDDLETEESDTDEDFYDEHPQKLASEMLAEKRRQLMKQTCLSPSHNYDIVENSRPSTPSLPEDVYGSINNREKKVKVKKKKRERKTSNKNLIPPFKLALNKPCTDEEGLESPFVPPVTPIQTNTNESISATLGNKIESFIPSDDADVLAINAVASKVSETPEISSIFNSSTISNATTPVNYHNFVNSNVLSTALSALTSTQSVEAISENYQSPISPSAILNPSLIRPPIHPTQTVFSAVLPARIDPNFVRHSTESSSDASANMLSNTDIALKRSKRARRPNRFYGYSSDDEATHNAALLGTSGVFKPIPPPNLTWRKEDLPTPPRSSSGKNIKPSGIKSSLLSGSKKMKLFSKKKDDSVKKAQSFVSKISKVGNPSSISTPKIPTLKIKPMDILPQIPPSILDHQLQEINSFQRMPQPPPVVEPINSLPPVQVHHIDPPQFYPSSKESIDSDSESDEDKLTIPLQIFNTESKPVSQTKAGKKSSTPKVTKNNQNKSNKSKAKNNSGTRTTYNTLAPVQINNSLQNIPSEIKEKTPPPPKEKKIPLALLPNPDLATLQYFKRNNIRYPIRPPAGARPPREGESVYCYCRCPYDEVSEMIACDGDDCMIEWFHFECVGILVAPQGKWFCAECKPNQQIYSSSQNITQLQTQIYQSQNTSDIANISNYGNSSINNLSGFNGHLINNSNAALSTSSRSITYQ
ncbi:uncharacterized protein LOC129614229 [Condylostylus longicornis]|uniref:uncharacterized protein LOC129614229 n=1 Tax=Condylostylus longicornis TaxID=2530218 RepID=UPI00244DB645|nr:uncharacterized protein LOC129614229 [Condylostylus longicornis]XP_055384686.1 uncharacterized protein LOC129614229 [Condylostylus longicornis]XP_055384688.1 uncharacterized protein LOC129614229 [Condylostylus longicornis]